MQYKEEYILEQWINNVLSSNEIIKPILKIEDLGKLKITKIRYNKLYFKYDNVRYFIIANYDCGDQWYSLYRKRFIDGKWTVELIKTSGWTWADIDSLLDENSRNWKGNYVYSHINKEYFVNKLKENNLVEVGL